MTYNFFKLYYFLLLMPIFGCSSIKYDTLKSIDIVKAYIDARNTYSIEKVSALVDQNYSETFMDGSKEIENKKQLLDRILWGKELDSHIKLLSINSEENTVVTIEESTNYIDTALKRQSRKFKIVYTFHNNKITSQIIDTLPGYTKVLKFNSNKFEEFTNYCDANNIVYNHHSFNQEFGAHLRAILEKYKNTTNKKRSPMKIRFEGYVNVITQDEDGENEEQVTAIEELEKLDNLTHSSQLSDYLFDGTGTENLKELNISGGTLGLKFQNNQILMCVEYVLTKKPNDTQINTLWKYTLEQLTDGAGPIFSDDCEDEIGLSPMFPPKEMSYIIKNNN